MAINIPPKMQFTQPTLVSKNAKTRPGKQEQSSDPQIGSSNNPEVLADNPEVSNSASPEPSDVRGTESGAYDAIDLEGIQSGYGG